MVGGPPQMDLFDYKPKMDEWYDKDLPDSIRMGQRLTTMTSGQARFPIAPSKFKFAQHGKCGMWVSELLPYTAKMVDDMCFIRRCTPRRSTTSRPSATCRPATRSPAGRASGSWASYGLGSLNENLPTFVVLVAKPTQHRAGAGDLGPALVSRATCPASTPACSFRTAGDPILYINNPPGVPAEVRRKTLDGLKAAQRDELPAGRRPRDAHAHPAVRDGLPHAGERAGADRPVASEPESTFELYGDDGEEAGHVRQHRAAWPGGMVERGVRFVQIYHNNWDTHANVAGRLPDQCRTSTRPCYGLIQDLKRTGLFDETLVIWGGEFGRTIYSQGGLTKDELRPRPPPALLHDVDGRRRHRRAARSTARPTTSPTTSSRTRSTSATSTPRCCTCSASTTSGSASGTRASTSG